MLQLSACQGCRSGITKLWPLNGSPGGSTTLQDFPAILLHTSTLGVSIRRPFLWCLVSVLICRDDKKCHRMDGFNNGHLFFTILEVEMPKVLCNSIQGEGGGGPNVYTPQIENWQQVKVWIPAKFNWVSQLSFIGVTCRHRNNSETAVSPKLMALWVAAHKSWKPRVCGQLNRLKGVLSR